jgi:hypothetical protein
MSCVVSTGQECIVSVRVGGLVLVLVSVEWPGFRLSMYGVRCQASNLIVLPHCVTALVVGRGLFRAFQRPIHHVTHRLSRPGLLPVECM